MSTHGGLHGTSQQSEAFAWTEKYVNKAMREISEGIWVDTPPMWTSFIITKDVKTRIHKDAHNLKGSKVLTVTLGDFTGGNLWLKGHVPGRGSTPATYGEGEHALDGTSISTKEKPFVFDPKCRHATEPWNGNRWCVSCFTTRGISNADQIERDSLRALGFPLRGLDALNGIKVYKPSSLPAPEINIRKSK